MQVVKYIAWGLPNPQARVGCLRGGKVRPAGTEATRLADLLHVPNPAAAVEAAWYRAGGELEQPLDAVQLVAPIDRQEVWGAGVTYERSKVAREEESEHGASFYDRVYRAERPEIFFKATPSRVVGPGQPIRVRQDSAWSVPEPELALVISPQLKVVGYTVGNDVSARDIEGENPLYLPQAKTYDACCALGPAITLADRMPPPGEIVIEMEIRRGGQTAIRDSTPLSRMVRRFEELVGWLGRDNLFIEGAVLLTGTGIVPPDDFSLRADDEVSISISGIGTLTNSVALGPDGHARPGQTL